MSIELTQEYLHREYTLNGRSDRDIAQSHNTYPNAIARLRHRYGIASRDKSMAQKLALEQGRHSHPTKGRSRSEGERLQISEGVARAWEVKSNEDRQEHIAKAKRQWDAMSEGDKEVMRAKAAVAVREAAEHGSKLERFLLEELAARGHRVEYHKDDLLSNEKLHVDLYLPTIRVAIEVDGIAHFEPIWGPEYLEKRQAADKEKTGLILGLGLVIIRVKHVARSLSAKRKRELLAQLLKVLNEKPTEPKVLEIEVN
jgi:very-short-patch-repair endonuclease